MFEIVVTSNGALPDKHTRANMATALFSTMATGEFTSSKLLNQSHTRCTCKYLSKNRNVNKTNITLTTLHYIYSLK